MVDNKTEQPDALMVSKSQSDGKKDKDIKIITGSSRLKLHAKKAVFFRLIDPEYPDYRYKMEYIKKDDFDMYWGTEYSDSYFYQKYYDGHTWMKEGYLNFYEDRYEEMKDLDCKLNENRIKTKFESKEDSKDYYLHFRMNNDEVADINRFVNKCGFCFTIKYPEKQDDNMRFLTEPRSTSIPHKRKRIEKRKRASSEIIYKAAIKEFEKTISSLDKDSNIKKSRFTQKINNSIVKQAKKRNNPITCLKRIIKQTKKARSLAMQI